MQCLRFKWHCCFVFGTDQPWHMCPASQSVWPGWALDSSLTLLKMRKDEASPQGEDQCPGTPHLQAQWDPSPFRLLVDLPYWCPWHLPLLAPPHLLFGLPSWPSLQPPPCPCGLAPWQSSWLTRILHDCWFLWLGSLNPASSLPGFRSSMGTQISLLETSKW
jgi:hypothetical protein